MLFFRMSFFSFVVYFIIVVIFLVAVTGRCLNAPVCSFRINPMDIFAAVED